MQAIFCRIATLTIICLLLTACAAQTASVRVGEHRFTVDVADTDRTRSRGLMFVEHMDDGHGMIFLFPNQEPRSFWMKNTKIPLDILYFDRNRRLVAWSLNTPPCTTRNCPSYPSRVPAQYVLEINGGLSKKLGIRLGDELVLEFAGDGD